MKISIIGAAGCVGSSVAFELATRALAQEIVMIDVRQDALTSHVMDISAAAYEEDVNVKAGSYEDLPGTDIIILAIEAPGVTPQDRLKANTLLFKDIATNIKKHCPEAIIITASNPIDSLNYSLSLLGFNRKQLLGYNLNDTIRFQIFAARALGVKPTRVSAVAGGLHARGVTMFFSSLKLDGKKIHMSEDQKQKVQKEVWDYIPTFGALKANRTAGWTCAIGISKIVRAIKDDPRTLMPCSVVLDGEYGYRSLGMGVPTIIGKEGLVEILEWDLPADERAELEMAANKIQVNCDIVRAILGLNR